MRLDHMVEGIERLSYWNAYNSSHESVFNLPASNNFTMTIAKLLIATLVLINTQQVYSQAPLLGSFDSDKCPEFSAKDDFKKDCTDGYQLNVEPTEECKKRALSRIHNIVYKTFLVVKTDDNKRIFVLEPKDLNWLYIVRIASTLFAGSSLGLNEKGELMVNTYRNMLLYFMRRKIPEIWRGIRVHNTEMSRFTHLFALHVIWQCISYQL